MNESTIDDLDAENKERIVNRALAILREHFHCGLVLVSNADENGTANMFKGFGNAYGQIGMAEAFVKGRMG